MYLSWRGPSGFCRLELYLDLDLDQPFYCWCNSFTLFVNRCNITKIHGCKNFVSLSLHSFLVSTLSYRSAYFWQESRLKQQK